MKRISKKMVALLLAAVMLVSILPVSAAGGLRERLTEEDIAAITKEFNDMSQLEFLLKFPLSLMSKMPSDISRTLTDNPNYKLSTDEMKRILDGLNDNEIKQMLDAFDYPIPPEEEPHTHQWGEWKVVTAAACEKAGKEERECVSCHEKESRDIAELGHLNEGKVVGAKEANCSEVGYTGDVVCSRCNAILTQGKEIPKSEDHDFGEWISINETQHQRVCSRDARHVETEEHHFVEGVCSECGYQKQPEPVKGHKITGTVSATGNDEAITVELILGENVKATVTAEKDGFFEFTDVADGDYVLRVSKLNFVTRDYAVIVAGDDVEQNMMICLLGDVNRNGIIDAGDYNDIYNRIVNDKEFDSEYIQQCADINGNGNIDAGDFNAIFNHIVNNISLWR